MTGPQTDAGGQRDGQMSFGGHLAALRPHLLRAAAAIVVASVAAFFLRQLLIDGILFGPKSPDFPTNRLLVKAGEWWSALCAWAGAVQGADVVVFDPAALDFRMINTRMAGQFNLHMTVALAAGFVVAMPYVVWEFWRFVRPALTAREVAATRRFVFWVSFCFFAGLLFGYYILSPLSISFFINYEASGEIVNMIDVGQYLSTVITASLASALLFQLPLLVYFLTRMGLLTAALLRRYRRHAFTLLLVLSAIITPPDVLSLVLVIVPVYGLYELSIRLAERIERRAASK